MAPGLAGYKNTAENEWGTRRSTAAPLSLNKHEAISRGSHWGVYALDTERKEVEMFFKIKLK